MSGLIGLIAAVLVHGGSGAGDDPSGDIVRHYSVVAPPYHNDAERIKHCDDLAAAERAAGETPVDCRVRTDGGSWRTLKSYE